MTRDPHWHRTAVGGLWHELGQLQFHFLVAQGLRPRHTLLDVGCGSLRGGLHFIRYLDTGRYFGVDKDAALLDAGRTELRQADLESKRPVLRQMEDFAFHTLNRSFDFALAQSVFTHLPLESVQRCLQHIETVLVPGGRFYATFLEKPAGDPGDQPVLHPRTDGPPFPSYPDRDPFHYPFQTFASLCAPGGLRVEYLGDWKHPRDQKMMVFIRESPP